MTAFAEKKNINSVISACSVVDARQAYKIRDSQDKRLLESSGVVNYNSHMYFGFLFDDEWMPPSQARALLNATRWNQYVGNWSIALDALRRLWELGRVSELKSPFYEPLGKMANH